MKHKFLLLILMLFGGWIYAQDTIDYLIITEWRGDNTNMTYLELTNVGDQPVQLSDFHIGHWGGGSTLDMATHQTPQNDHQIPVDYLLQPGESYVFAAYKEYGMRKHAEGFEGFPERNRIQNLVDAADFQVNLSEDNDDGTDIVDEGIEDPFNQQWGPGMNGFYIENHFLDAEGNPDSAVVDQVCGMFLGEGGANYDRTQGEGYDVAGYSLATGNRYMVRNAKVKKGNIDFNSTRGIDLSDSEWIPAIPLNGSFWRDAPWTVGNHGNFVLDETTLESDVIQVDFANKTLTVPWGVRRGDDIMHQFDYKPGVGWEYIIPEEVADSSTFAVQTGDQLAIYVCGETLTADTFDIIAAAPEASATTIVPRVNPHAEEPKAAIQSGQMNWPRITDHGGSRDTISGYRDGIPFSMRVDSLLQQLHKPANASWEIVYTGDPKPDLTHGDMIKVTAEDGTVKEYFISERDFLPSHNAQLSSITWPDIPEFYRGLFGWIGDTIPGFNPGVINYSISLPPTTTGIPALVGKVLDINSKVETKRPSSLAGGEADRTMTFTVTAEDDTTMLDYNVLLTKQVDPAKLQPFSSDPFISEVIMNDGWQGNDGLELFNPGNQVLDLSKYMIVGSWANDPVAAISSNTQGWMDRYDKYIPGYKWQDTTNWAAQPYIAVPDLSVNKILEPGDVFTMAMVKGLNGLWCSNPDFPYPFFYQTDVHFQNFEADCYVFENQWGEEINNDGTPFSKFQNNYIFLYKILNDSIHQGLKAATDPADFELIDALGMPEKSPWKIADSGRPQGSPFNLMRKPNVWHGNPVVGASLAQTPGQTIDDAEWDFTDRNYWKAEQVGWPWEIAFVLNDFGKHFMQTPTHYMSTVTSLVYKISEGYSMEEQIRGVTTGTTVSGMLNNVTMADTGQSLVVTATADGAELGPDALLSNSDTLTVISADSTNMTKYVLEVTEQGLSNDALLVSDAYTIDVTTQPDGPTMGAATISGFDYNTNLKTVVENVTVPSGASMSMITEDGNYATFTMLNFDTTYMDVKVNDRIYFEVIAENGVTGIMYQLTPDMEEGAVFVTSNIYDVNQESFLIGLVPKSIGLQSFLSYLTPSPGATIMVQDKAGFERVDGGVADDDRVVVTSADGQTSVVYYISKLETNQALFLAYITSEMYAISQLNFVIDGVVEGTSVEDFLSNVEAATGATVKVVDNEGNDKTTGALAATDLVIVTSGDGSLEVKYSFDEFVVGTEMFTNYNIEFFPNPSDGMLNVRGVENGFKIHVYNAYGARVINQEMISDRETIYINQHPAGVYMIVVFDNKEQMIGNYKVVKY